jgi:hypothetical protein
MFQHCIQAKFCHPLANAANMSGTKSRIRTARKASVSRRPPARGKLAEHPALDRALQEGWERWRKDCARQPIRPVVIRLNKLALQRMWIERLVRWSYSYEPVMLEMIAADLAARNPLTDEQLEYLKDLKNRGDDLRGFFQLFSVAHEIPRAIQALVKMVGQIRDQVRLGEIRRAQLQARELRQLLARTLRVRWPQFQVSAHDFHQFKKDFRLLFSVYGYLHPQPDRVKPKQDAFSATRQAVKQMHQVLLEGKYLRALRYREFRITLPEEFQIHTLRLLRAVKLTTR